MEFQRGSDIKDSLKIGRWANAAEVYHLSIRVGFPILDQDRSKHMVYDIEGEELREILEMLDSEGLNIKVHEKLMGIAKREFIERKNVPRFFDMDGVHLINAAFGNIPPETEPNKNGRIYIQKDAIPRFFGKDVIFRGKLYEIKDDTENPGYWNE